MNLTNIPHFINTHITKRDTSMFQSDLEKFSVQLFNEINSKSVLVIGGAGTIGSSFIKALLKFKPAKLIVVDTNENGLTELTRDLRSEHGQYIPAVFLTYPMNFGDHVFEKMFLNHAPFDIVANFAAHKHVRSEKDQFSIEAMLTNNVFKANSFLDLLLKYKPKHFFCVSTDKAANPVNMMGASKLIMEMFLMRESLTQNVSMARFANVAFSDGSLLHGFNQRFAKRQPFSAPNDVCRYFVTPQESGELCLLSGLIGNNRDIFFPKLSEKLHLITFSEVAVRYLIERGYEPYECESENEARDRAEDLIANGQWPCYFFTSDTTGEKDFEEFFTDHEDLDMDYFETIGVIRNQPKFDDDKLNEFMDGIEELRKKDTWNKQDIVNLYYGILPEFAHKETGKYLDQRM